MHHETTAFSETLSAQDMLGISNGSRRSEIIAAYENKKNQLLNQFEARQNSVVFRHSLSQLDLALKEVLGTQETLNENSDGFDDILSASLLPGISAQQAMNIETEDFGAFESNLKMSYPTFSSEKMSTVLPNDPLDLPEFSAFFDSHSATKRIYAPSAAANGATSLRGYAQSTFSTRGPTSFSATPNNSYLDNQQQSKPQHNFAQSKTRARLSNAQAEALNTVLNQTEILTGAVLKQMRLAAGLSQKEICSTLRMQNIMFDAIENDQFRERPAAVYLRGFVVSYLKFLGIDSTELVETFMIHHKQNVGR